MYRAWLIILCCIELSYAGLAQTQDRRMSESSLRLISESPLIYDSYLPMPTFDGSSVWIMANNELWEFSLKDQSWKKTHNIQLPFEYKVIAKDTVHQQFIIWSDLGGNIYRLQKNSQYFDSLYVTDNARYMINHTRVIRYPQGNILVFGGYGFWQARNLVAEFDVNRRKWNPLFADPKSAAPVPRAQALGVFDEQHQQFHIFGGHTYRYFRQDLSNDMVMLSDYWVFDIATKRWDAKALYSKLQPVDYLNNANLDHVFTGAINIRDRIAWYPIILNNKINVISLLTFDLDADFGALSPLEILFLPSNIYLKGSFYDQNQNQLIFVGVVKGAISDQIYFRIYALSLPDAGTVRAQLQSMKQSYLMQQAILPIAIVVGFFLVFLVGIRYQKQLKTIFDGKSALSEIKKMTILVQSDQKASFAIYINQQLCTAEFTPFEQSILDWMFQHLYQPQSSLSTDHLEARFWTQTHSIDYVRKQRNVAIKRINQKFENLLGVQNPLFVERIHQLDKRKREYYIGLSHILINYEFIPE